MCMKDVSSYSPDANTVERKVIIVTLHIIVLHWPHIFVLPPGKGVDKSLAAVTQGYQKSKVTPCMHVLATHAPEMIRLHGNIKQFSCQGKRYTLVQCNHFSHIKRS